MTSRSNPFDDIERLFDRMSEQFETLEPADLGVAGGHLPVDVYDQDDTVVVVADLPGYDSDNIDVTLPDDRTLRVSAERETSEAVEEAGKTVRTERRESASRSVRLPAEVDAEGTSARYENGVLTVTLTKPEADDDDGQSIPVN